MTEQSRNTIVGLTIAAGLVLLAGLIVMLAGLPEKFQRGRHIRIQMHSAASLKEGDVVHMAGIQIGHILSIRFTDKQDPSKGVTIKAQIRPDLFIPANTACWVSRSMMGAPYVEFGPDPEAPPEAAAEAADLSQPIKGISRPPGPEGLRPLFEKLSEAGQDVGDLAARLMDSADRLSHLLTTLNRVAEKLESGEGTMGRLVNDPQLYHALVETSEQMTRMMEEYRRLAEEWRRNGVELKLK